LNGSIAGTLQLALPTAFEVGLDLFSGEFKKTVGLVDKPAVYLSATNSQDEDHKCKKGVELRVGIKNTIFIAALELWDYIIPDDILYEKGLTCVT
jgi:hypothetical protein